MDEAIDQQATVVYPEPKGVPARIVRAHEELTAQHGSGAVCTIPLAEGERAVGALTLERPADRPFDGQAIALCEALAAAVGPVLEMRRRDDRWIVTKAVDAVPPLAGPADRPAPCRPQGRDRGGACGHRLPASRRGRLSRVGAHGDRGRDAARRRRPVQRLSSRGAGARRATWSRRGRCWRALDDRELRLERVAVGEPAGAVRRAAATRPWRRGTPPVRHRRGADRAGAQAQLALIDEQLGRTRVAAPFDGVVVTGDLSQSLGAPVERGQVLFEVAPLDAYRVVLQVDERDIADVTRRAARRARCSPASPADAAPVHGDARSRRCRRPRDGRNYFRVEARWTRRVRRVCARAWRASARSRSTSAAWSWIWTPPRDRLAAPRAVDLAAVTRAWPARSSAAPGTAWPRCGRGCARHARIHRHRYRGRSGTCCRTAPASRFHRFSPAAYLVIGAHGRPAHRAGDLGARRARASGDDAPTQDEVIQLLAQLHAADVLQSRRAAGRRRAVRAAREAGAAPACCSRGRQPRVAWRFPLLDPERLLRRARAARAARCSAGWARVLLWLLVGGAGARCSRPRTGTTSPTTSSTGCSLPRTCSCSGLLFPLLKALHELGHAHRRRRPSAARCTRWA